MTSTSTSCTVGRSPPMAVSNGGVNTGVKSILHLCSAAVFTKFPTISHQRSEKTSAP